MLGKIKQKFANFVDSRIQNYNKTHKVAEDQKDNVEFDDMSMAEAEARKQQNSLLNNLRYSFQKDFSIISAVCQPPF